VELSTLAVVPGAVLDGVSGVPASLPGPGGLKVLGHGLAFDILQERCVGPVGVSRGGGVKLGARTRSRSSGRGLDGEGGVTYLLLSGRGPRSSPFLQQGCKGCCSPGAGVCAGEVCARTEVRGHICDINLATGCVRALPLLLPSCGRQRGGGGSRGLLSAGEGAARAAALRGMRRGGWSIKSQRARAGPPRSRLKCKGARGPATERGRAALRPLHAHDMRTCMRAALLPRHARSSCRRRSAGTHAGTPTSSLQTTPRRSSQERSSHESC
jgi:hypothetical protein